MPLDRLAQPPDILRALPSAMAGAPARPMRDVVAALRQGGLRLPKAVGEARDLMLDVVDESHGLWSVGDDDDLLDVVAILAGRTFTHRLTELEVRDAVLSPGMDVSGLAFDHVIATGLTLPDGRVVQYENPLGTALQVSLAPGTWADFGRTAGELVGVSFDRGVARLYHVHEVGDDHDLVLSVRRTLAEADPLDIDSLLDALVVGTDHFRAPSAPMTEILVANGFVIGGDLISSSRRALDEMELARAIRRLRADFDLEPREAESVAGFLGLVHSVEDTLTEGRPLQGRAPTDPAVAARLLEIVAGFQARVGDRQISISQLRRTLADPWLAEVAATVALDHTDPCPDGLALLAGILEDSQTAPGTRSERASLAYLIGRCREWEGDPLDAEPHFKRAVALAPDHSAALVSLAGLAVDRGSYSMAASLLDRAGVDEDHPLRTAIEAAHDTRSAPQRTLGRNEPCWCGSGRKFKVCHARVSTTPLPTRARSILSRALAWQSVVNPTRLRSLIMHAVIAGGRESLESVFQIAPDTILIEGGGLADYLDRRGALIPDDEVLLAQQWLLRPRSVFEVEAVTPGAGLILRDLASGERHEVVERTASHELAVGTLILTRVAPVGETNELYGGVFPIQLHERDPLLELLAGDPVPSDVIAHVARRFRGPELVTSEGDRLLHVVGTLTTPSPRQLRAALDALLSVTGADAWAMTEPGAAGGTRILASFSLSGRTLEVSAMSEERFERALAVLDGLDVALVERSRDVVDPRSMPTPDRGEPGQRGAPSVDLNEQPEIQAALAAYIAQYEQSWLDESIPALGGVTPRAAAADPTRREDLIRLLDTFPATGSPTQMDGARLRAALGL